jgi:hypothetical protein
LVTALQLRVAEFPTAFVRFPSSRSSHGRDQRRLR